LAHRTNSIYFKGIEREKKTSGIFNRGRVTDYETNLVSGETSENRPVLKGVTPEQRKALQDLIEYNQQTRNEFLT
jgi:hypothetical protein